jgi:hypothetical protein
MAKTSRLFSFLGRAQGDGCSSPGLSGCQVAVRGRELEDGDQDRGDGGGKRRAQEEACGRAKVQGTGEEEEEDQEMCLR